MRERETYYLTKEGSRRLEQKIKETKEKMAKNAKWLIDSPALSPAIENYYLDQLELNRLIAIQKNAQTVSQEEAEMLGIGRKITILDPEVGEPEKFIVLSSQEANPSGGIISFESPLAKATLGKGDGEEIEIRTPMGNQRVVLLQTEWIFSGVNSEQRQSKEDKEG